MAGLTRISNTRTPVRSSSSPSRTTRLNVLWFLLTDFQGNPLTYIGDHTIVLRIRTLKTKTKEAIELQQEMVGILKDQLMQQTLGL